MRCRSQDQKEKRLPSVMSLQRPLLTKLGIMPAGKGKKFEELSTFSQSRQLRVNLELRGIKWITGTG